MRFTAVHAAALAMALVAAGAVRSPVHAKGAKSAPKKTAIGACVHYNQAADEDQRKLTFRIDNQCAVEVRCALSWEVKCVAENGSKTSARHTDGGELSPGSAGSYEASAAECRPGDGYEIGKPTWSCSAVTAHVASSDEPRPD